MKNNFEARAFRLIDGLSLQRREEHQGEPTHFGEKEGSPRGDLHYIMGPPNRGVFG